MPLRSIITYQGANEPKTSSVLKLNAQSPFQKMSRKTYFQKMCWANFVNFSHALRDLKQIFGPEMYFFFPQKSSIANF